ncbi:MAG TPA: CHAT domain-containing protein, partial [Gemmatirosa sp.]
DPTAPGVRLRQRVFDPLVPLFDGRTRLIVAPDGSLWTLPLECLPTDLGEPLLAQYGISYVSSARSAAVMHADRAPEPRSPAHGPPRSSALVIGAPDYDLPRAASTAAASTAAASTAAASTAASAALADSAFRFGPLPGTRDEACAVADVFGVEPTLGAAATTACVRGARDPLAVHFATHGFALDASAAGGRLAGAPLLRTGLALAGANARAMDGDDAGVLTADEVASLNLRATALVVLSACKTGLGEIEYGEGLASLARSFEAAGAACVIAGLWSVPDAETRDLMTAFYRRLTPECGVADALRQAKLELWRRHGDVRGWGAFVCTGAWGPVTLRPLDAPGAAALG